MGTIDKWPLFLSVVLVNGSFLFLSLLRIVRDTVTTVVIAALFPQLSKQMVAEGGELHCCSRRQSPHSCQLICTPILHASNDMQ